MKQPLICGFRLFFTITSFNKCRKNTTPQNAMTRSESPRIATPPKSAKLYAPKDYENKYRSPVYLRQRANSLDSVSTTTTMQSNLPAYKEALKEVATYYHPIRTSFSQNKDDKLQKVYQNAVDQVSDLYSSVTVNQKRTFSGPSTSSFPQPVFPENIKRQNPSALSLVSFKSSIENLLTRNKTSFPLTISTPVTDNIIQQPAISPRLALTFPIPEIVPQKTCQEALWTLKAQGHINVDSVTCNPTYHVRVGDLCGLKYHLDVIDTNPNITYPSFVGKVQKKLPLIFWMAAFAPAMQIMPMLRLITEHYKAYVARTYGDDTINLLTCVALNKSLFEHLLEPTDGLLSHHPDFVAVAEWCLVRQNIMPDSDLLKEMLNSGAVIGDIDYIFQKARVMTIPQQLSSSSSSQSERKYTSSPIGNMFEGSALTRKCIEKAISMSLTNHDDPDMISYLYKSAQSLPSYSTSISVIYPAGSVVRQELSSISSSSNERGGTSIKSLTSEHIALCIHFRRKESLRRILCECTEASDTVILEESIRLAKKLDEQTLDQILRRRVLPMSQEWHLVVNRLNSLHPKRNLRQGHNK